MTSFRKHAAYAAGALAVLSGITGLLAWMLPSSAAWLNRHGLIAWPLATFLLTLFVWAASNWNQTQRDLAAVRARILEPVREDQRMYRVFKEALPKDSHVITWLRNSADASTYHLSDMAPLHYFHSNWTSSDQHFVNAELERAVRQLVEAADDFLSYQGLHAAWDPREQANPEDPMYKVYESFEGDFPRERDIRKGLGDRADRVLAAHNELYMLGSRLGL